MPEDSVLNLLNLLNLQNESHIDKAIKYISLAIDELLPLNNLTALQAIAQHLITLNHQLYIQQEIICGR